MGATQDPKYYRMSPYMSELISEGQEGRGGGGGEGVGDTHRKEF